MRYLSMNMGRYLLFIGRVKELIGLHHVVDVRSLLSFGLVVPLRCNSSQNLSEAQYLNCHTGTAPMTLARISVALA